MAPRRRLVVWIVVAIVALAVIGVVIPLILINVGGGTEIVTTTP